MANKNPNLTVHLLKSQPQNKTIYDIEKSNLFEKVDDIKTLNFGLLEVTHWLKIEISNLENDKAYTLHIATVTVDTLEIFEKKDTTFKQKFIGEGFESDKRFMNYEFKPVQNKTIIYIKVIGNGQPVAMPISVIKNDKNYNIYFFVTGIIYGMILLIIFLNLIIFIVTLEFLYLYILFFNICATSVLLYFDGFVKLYFFPNSLYWNNQFIGIALCGSFIATNFYVPEFLRLKQYTNGYTKAFKISTYVFLALLAISFWHPTGFRFYIITNLLITYFEAFLILFCVIEVRKLKETYFYIQFTSVIMLVVFGTSAQIYFIGALSINFYTENVIYFMVLPQIFIQSYALYNRFATIVIEKENLQTDLLNSSQKHAQSLIITLEKERSRLSSEFHDGIGQNILVIRNRILLLLKKDKLTPTQSQKLDDLAILTSETLDEIRAIAQDLRPSMLNYIGITASLHHLVDKIKKSTIIQINYFCSENIDKLLDTDVDINLYRIMQELFNNLLKHSQATKAVIHIYKQNDFIIISMKDNGVGFDYHNKRIFGEGNGLSGIKERIKILKGNIDFETDDIYKTILNIQIPIAK